MKSGLLDGRLRLDAAMFYHEFDAAWATFATMDDSNIAAWLPHFSASSRG